MALTHLVHGRVQAPQLLPVRAEELVLHGGGFPFQGLGADAHQAQLLTPALTLADCLDARLVARRYPGGPPAWGPLRLASGRVLLLNDPYGYDFAFHDGKVVSPGLFQVPARNHVPEQRALLQAASKGAAVSSMAQAERLIALPWLPPCARWVMGPDGQLDIQWDPPEHPPWKVGGDAAR